LGDELFSKLYEMSDPATTPVIPSEKKYELPTASNYAMADTTEEGAIPKIVFEKPVEGVGSNNWAVSPSKSSTGHAILCGDPHLALNLPSVWIEMQISTDSFNSYGVSIPGMAGIMIGFNEHMAWSETNVGIDVKDFYRIKWKDKTRKEYWLDSVWKPAQMDIKEIKVKGRPSVFDTMYITDLGIVNTISTDATQDLAMRWIATEPLSSPEFMTFIDLMQCKNVDQFNEKLSVFNSPAQNFISADIDGNISLRVNGKIPVRGLRDGLFIEDGTKSSNLWSSYIPFSELPHLKNPLQGYLTSSNQKSTDASYPYYYSLPSADHFRNRVINEILAQPKSFSVKDMRTMQGNTISAKARAMVPLITSNLIPENAKLSEVFKDWDFRYDKGELAPAVFDEYFSKLSEEVYDEVFKLKDSFDIRLPMSYVLINLVANEPNSSIFDLKSTPSIVESAKDIINRVATAYLNDKESSLAKNEVWPKRKKLDIPHILRLPALSVNDLEVDGSGDAINAVGNVAPSWRMVVHLNKNNIEAWGVYPGGQSGDPASKYYKNFIDKWVRREHYKLYFAKTAEDFTNNKVQAITFSKA
jgi:penicillin G amidase